MSDVASVRDLLKVRIVWKRVVPGRWGATVEGVACSLRMNDFPDEPLYTVSALGEEIDLDDAPQSWRIEFPQESHRE